MTNPFAQTAQQRNTTGMLAAFAAFQKPMYLGTVPPAEKAKRRAKNKAARKARRANRG